MFLYHGEVVKYAMLYIEFIFCYLVVLQFNPILLNGRASEVRPLQKRL